MEIYQSQSKRSLIKYAKINSTIDATSKGGLKMKQLCRNKNDNILTTTLCTVLSIKMKISCGPQVRWKN